MESGTMSELQLEARLAQHERDLRRHTESRAARLHAGQQRGAHGRRMYPSIFAAFVRRMTSKAGQSFAIPESAVRNAEGREQPS
jgi:hypothetical protein